MKYATEATAGKKKTQKSTYEYTLKGRKRNRNKRDEW